MPSVPFFFFFFFFFFLDIGKSVDSDQNAASDQGLHCLLIGFFFFEI